MALTRKQARFVAEYLKDLNATQAAIRCGYSAKTAKQQGSRLLTKAAIKKALAEQQQARADRLGFEADDVLRELKNIALCDIAQIFNSDGTLKKLDEMPEEARRAIAGVEVNDHYNSLDGTLNGRTSKLKLWSKTEALGLLGKYFKLFTDVVDHRITAINVVDPYAEVGK